tara:strand:+ start:12471 stop:13217 length:747 start_codon:yes stop_codon:yes gene_type:complete
METPRSTKRNFLWLILLFATFHILTTGALVAGNYATHRSSNAVHTKSMSMAPPQQKKQIASRIVDLSSSDYWVPTIGDALLLPLIHHSLYQERYAEGAAIISTACLGVSIMWYILFCVFQTTRKRTKLRMIHVARAVIVAGSLPFLLIEAARLIEAVQLLSNFNPTPFRVVSNTLPFLIMIVSVWMMVWTQWFWITASRIGWQIKAKWWELVLVTTASFLGMPIAGLIMLAFKPVRAAVEHFAYWFGI